MQEICLYLCPDGGRLSLPLARNGILQGVFYHLLSSDAALSAAVHDFDDPGSRVYKYFCFSDLIGNARAADRQIIYDGPVSWFIRSADDGMLQAVVDSVTAEPFVRFGGTVCPVASFELRERVFCSDTVRFSMNTPIAVYQTDADGTRRFFTPDNPMFCRIVENNLIRKYAALSGEEPAETPRFSVLRFSEKDVRRVRYHGQIITACGGSYSLTAPSAFLELAYYCGIGSKNAAGLGTIGTIL